MIKYSIIIPIYGVEAYIERAFESVYNQGICDDEFEVIAVNDGTPDNSMVIVEKYAKCHSNLIIINQANAGVSVARNVGIRAAQGKYITFLDPDDWFVANTLRDINIQICEQQDSDIFILQSHKNGQEVYEFSSIVTSGQNIGGVELYSRGFYRGSVCGGIYKRSFLLKNNISFAKGVTNAEDTLFFAVCQACNASMTFIKMPFYVVFERNGSASRRSFTECELLDKYTKTLRAIKAEIIARQNLETKNIGILEHCMYMVISNFVYFVIQQKIPFCTIRKCISEYLPINKKNFSFAKSKVILLNKFPILFYLLCKIKSSYFQK